MFGDWGWNYNNFFLLDDVSILILFIAIMHLVKGSDCYGCTIFPFYFFPLFLTFSIYYALLMDLVISFVQWLSYCTDTLLSPFTWLMGMSLWSRPPAQLLLPTFISVLCRAMLFISISSLPYCGYATVSFISTMLPFLRLFASFF